jgi:putative photosynthetic complex assembly protein
MSAMDRDPFPRSVLIGTAALLAATVLMVAAVQWERRYGPPPEPSAQDLMQPLEQRVLLFVPGEGDRLSVVDKASGETIGDLNATDGFIRTLLQSLKFDRDKIGIDAEQSYILSLWPDGRITFEDPATNIRVNTGAFGQPTKDRFYRFLRSGDSAREAAVESPATP